MDTDSYHLELIHKAVAGDHVALTVLMTSGCWRLETYLAPKIPRDLRGSVGVDDIVQEALVEGYRHLSRFVPRGPDSFQRWLATIAIRRLRNAIKRERAAKRGGERMPITTIPADLERSVVALLDLMAGSDHSASRAAARAEAVTALQAAIAALPDDYRRVVQLVYLEGQSVASAAASMGRTERAVHNLCYKAKRHLHDLLGSGSRFLSSRG